MKAYPYSAGNMYIEMDGRWTPSLNFQDDLLPQLPLLDPTTGASLILPERIYPTPMTNLGSGLGAQ